MEKPAGIVEKFVVSADGTKVFAGAVGDPTKPALVFVHGYTLNSSVFNDLFAKPQNSKDFYLVRFDMRGHGRTGKPNTVEGYSSQKHAEDYAAVVKEFHVKKPIIVGWSWGGTIAGDVATYLPPNSMLGAVYIASHPTIRTAFPLTIMPGFLPIWNARGDEKAAASDFPVAFNRLCVSRIPDAPQTFFEETLKLNAEGANFVSENPAATYEIRSALMGMMTTMQLSHRTLVLEHLNDDKILDFLAEGFPVLEVMGSHDGFIHCGKIVDSLRSIARNIDVHIVEGGSHAPFVDAPDEVMGIILNFAKKVHAGSTHS